MGKGNGGSHPLDAASATAEGGLTMKEIIGAIIIFVLMGWSLWQLLNILDFFNEVPKQLKRIADALEKLARRG